MSSFLLTRRQFHLVWVGSVFALAASNAAQLEQPDLPVSAAIDLVNLQLASPMPPDQAKRVGETVQSLQKTVQMLRGYPLPEGAEPAFVFQPLPIRRVRR